MTASTTTTTARTRPFDGDDGRDEDDDDDVNDGGDSTTTSRSELRLFAELAVPTVVVQLGFFVPPFAAASYVGRYFSTRHFDGFALANLVGNLFVLSVLQGLYSASDTLSPQAFGAKNYRRVGSIALRGYVASLLLTVPVNVALLFALEPALVSLVGIDASAARYASAWYSTYAYGLPFYSLSTALWKYLGAQNVARPLVVATLWNCAATLPVAMYLLCPIPAAATAETKTDGDEDDEDGDDDGFIGTARCVVLYQISQAAMVFGYCQYTASTAAPTTTTIPTKMTTQELLQRTWPDLSDARTWREAACRRKPLVLYLRLATGGILATSEWVYWEALSLAIGTLGVVPLGAHTVATQVVTVSFLIPFGIGIAVAIRLGTTLAASDPASDPASAPRKQRNELPERRCQRSSLLAATPSSEGGLNNRCSDNSGTDDFSDSDFDDDASVDAAVRRAKRLVFGTFAVSTAIFGATSLLLYVFRYSVIRIFVGGASAAPAATTTTSATSTSTNAGGGSVDSSFSSPSMQVLEGCDEIWAQVCLYIFLLSVFALCTGTATGLGMQWTLGTVNFVCLWLVGLPSAYYFGIVKYHSLPVVWNFITPPYWIMNAGLMFVFGCRTDWHRIARTIRQREEDGTSEMPLLLKSIELADEKNVHSIEGGDGGAGVVQSTAVMSLMGDDYHAGGYGSISQAGPDIQQVQHHRHQHSD